MSSEPAGPGTRTTGPDEALELAAALQKFGWEREGGNPGRYETWARSTDEQASSVLVPLDVSKRDYRHLLERARSLLVSQIGSEAEHFLASLHQRSRAALDATRFGKDTSVELGMISWDQGQALFDAARSILVAAAKASRDKRRYYGNAGSYIARSFVESSLMGQTEVGSFVVTAFTPATERFFTRKSDEGQPGQMRDVVSLSGREILQTLETALKTTHSALQEYRRTPRIELFGDAVVDGVSYELVTALSQLTSDSNESSVAMEYAPAGLHLLPNRVVIPFQSSDTPILGRAANYLARDRPPEDVTLQGRVTLLTRPRPGEAGIVRLDVTAGSEASKVRVRLEAEDYSVALEAHREDTVLSVRGRLEREGQHYWLYDTTDLEVASDISSESSTQLLFNLDETETSDSEAET